MSPAVDLHGSCTDDLEGLRDIATCLNPGSKALYHLGFREKVAKPMPTFRGLCAGCISNKACNLEAFVQLFSTEFGAVVPSNEPIDDDAELGFSSSSGSG
ncbi:MAG: hypothetical protein WCP60_11175 [bacterium]